MPTIVVENVWKSYVAGVRGCSARVWSLRGCGLTVGAGECVAIVGRPGSGKSTLLQCIAGLRSLDAGRIQSGFAHTVFMGADDLCAGAIGRPSRALFLIDGVACAHEAATRAVPAIQFRSRNRAAIILTARDVASVRQIATRICVLQDGRIAPLHLLPVRRVAERASVSAAFDMRESSSPGIARG